MLPASVCSSPARVTLAACVLLEMALLVRVGIDINLDGPLSKLAGGIPAVRGATAGTQDRSEGQQLEY
jgi:hypothetical protein